MNKMSVPKFIQKGVQEIAFSEIPMLIADIAKEAEKDVREQLNSQLAFAIRNYATPKVTGEITQGKLRQRGITIQQDLVMDEYWAEQRGKVLGKKIKVEYTFKTV